MAEKLKLKVLLFKALDRFTSVATPEKGLGIYLSKEQLPQGGFSETVDALKIKLSTIWAKIEELSRVKR